MGSVLVGLSGGVDSAVAAGLLARAGWDVTAVTMLLWGGARQGSSCSTADATAAQAAADSLGIPLRVVDWRESFVSEVVAPHAQSAAEGATSNPCFSCNRVFKLEGMVSLADQWGISKVATGHYARVRAGRLCRAADPLKDQSYVLAAASSRHLERFVFPLGGLAKAQVRSLASAWGLPMAESAESMGLCLERQSLTSPVPVQLVGLDGTPVGAHPRGDLLTVGQRRGIAAGGSSSRRYVVDVDLTRQQAVVGTAEDLYLAYQPVGAWVDTSGVIPQTFQVSAHGQTLPGRLEGDRVVWREPQRKVAPGQLVVGYARDAVVGYAAAVKAPLV